MREIWEKYKRTGRKYYRDQLAEHYLPIVSQVAQRMLREFPLSVDVQDLISTGMFGLLDAIRMFDINRGFSFQTYSAYRIRGAIRDGRRNMDWVTRRSREHMSRYNRTCTYLQKKLGREPTDFEIARKLGLNQRQYTRIAKIMNKPGKMVSLNAILNHGRNEQDIELEAVIKCPNAESHIGAILLKDFVGHLKNKISPKRDRLILDYLFDEGLTMEETGRKLGIYQSQVCLDLHRIITRLKDIVKHYELELIA